jgi:hypothetical protein
MRFDDTKFRSPEDARAVWEAIERHLPEIAARVKPDPFAGLGEYGNLFRDIFRQKGGK